MSLADLRAYAEETDPEQYDCAVDPRELLALLDVAEAAETVDDECGVTHAELLNALDRLREVTS